MNLASLHRIIERREDDILGYSISAWWVGGMLDGEEFDETRHGVACKVRWPDSDEKLFDLDYALGIAEQLSAIEAKAWRLMDISVDAVRSGERYESVKKYANLT